MTKHPQTRMGYYVDGKLVLKPVTRPVDNDSRNKGEHVFRNKMRRAQLATWERQRQLNNTMAALRRQSPSYQEAKEDLKNSSKIGDLSQVIQHIGTMLKDWPIPPGEHERDASVAKLSQVIRILYTPDSEERSALYYACHAGQTSLVLFYLSLWGVVAMDSFWTQAPSVPFESGLSLWELFRGFLSV